MPTEEQYIEFEKWKSSQESGISKFVKSISGMQMFLLIALIGVFIVVLTNSENRNMKIGIGVLIIIVLIFFYSKSKIDVIITKPVAMLLVEDDLDRERGNRIQIGTEITVGPYCKIVDDHWNVQVTLKFPDGLIREGKMQVRLKGGFITGFEEMLTGYTGEETKTESQPVFVERFTETEEK